MLDETSKRIDILKSILIIFVVYIHAQSFISSSSFLIESLSSDISYFVKQFISNGIARSAVPLFYVISGLFFFKYNEKLNNYISVRLTSRVKSVLIPFFLWNVLFYFALAIVCSNSNLDVSGVTRGYDILNLSLYKTISLIFGFEEEPILYQFWFIRDLIILFIFTYPIFFLLRKIPIISLFFFSLLWFFNIGYHWLPKDEALFFFYLGAYIGYYRINFINFDRGFEYVSLSYIFLLVLNSFHPNLFYYKIMVLLGVIFWYQATAYLSRNALLNSLLLRFSSYSFFVFAFHEPLLTAIRKLYGSLSPIKGGGAEIVIFFIAPILTIFLSLLISMVISKLLPKFYHVMTGGR